MWKQRFIAAERANSEANEGASSAPLPQNESQAWRRNAHAEKRNAVAHENNRTEMPQRGQLAAE